MFKKDIADGMQRWLLALALQNSLFSNKCRVFCSAV